MRRPPFPFPNELRGGCHDVGTGSPLPLGRTRRDSESDVPPQALSRGRRCAPEPYRPLRERDGGGLKDLTSGGEGRWSAGRLVPRTAAVPAVRAAPLQELRNTHPSKGAARPLTGFVGQLVMLPLLP